MKTIDTLDFDTKSLEVAQDENLVALTIHAPEGTAFAAFGRNDARTLAAYLRLHGKLESEGFAPNLERESRTGTEHFLLKAIDNSGTFWESSDLAIKRGNAEIGKVRLDHGDRLQLAELLESAATEARLFEEAS